MHSVPFEPSVHEAFSLSALVSWKAISPTYMQPCCLLCCHATYPWVPLILFRFCFCSLMSSGVLAERWHSLAYFSRGSGWGWGWSWALLTKDKQFYYAALKGIAARVFHKLNSPHNPPHVQQYLAMPRLNDCT